MTQKDDEGQEWKTLCRKLLDVRWWTIRSVQIDETDKEFFDACQAEYERLTDADHRDAQQLRERVWVLEEALRALLRGIGESGAATTQNSLPCGCGCGRTWDGHHRIDTTSAYALLSPEAATEGREGA